MGWVVKYTVGQKLWWVPPHNHHRPEINGGYEVEVTKVGVKYVTVVFAFSNSHFPLNHVFCKEGGEEKDSYQLKRGKAYLSREVYESYVAKREAWKDVQKAASNIGRLSLPSITLAEMVALKAIMESLLP